MAFHLALPEGWDHPSLVISLSLDNSALIWLQHSRMSTGYKFSWQCAFKLQLSFADPCLPLFWWHMGPWGSQPAPCKLLTQVHIS